VFKNLEAAIEIYDPTSDDHQGQGHKHKSQEKHAIGHLGVFHVFLLLLP
jgi:hypothetical protein